MLESSLHSASFLTSMCLLWVEVAILENRAWLMEALCPADLNWSHTISASENVFVIECWIGRCGILYTSGRTSFSGLHGL